MPHVAITMLPGRDDAAKRALALKTQELLVKELGIDPKFVSVSIQDIPMEDWQKFMEQFSDDILHVKPGARGWTVTEESRLSDGITAQKSIFGDNIDTIRAAGFYTLLTFLLSRLKMLGKSSSSFAPTCRRGLGKIMSNPLPFQSTRNKAF